MEGGRCRYTIVRDNEDNAYHQVMFSGAMPPSGAAEDVPPS